MNDAPLELYLLRHADAGDPAAWDGDDAARPLSKKGRRQVRRLGRWLRDLGWSPDAVVTSPKVRARETAEGMAEELGFDPVAVDERLGGPLEPEALEAILEAADPIAMRVLLVGHDPDFSDLASTLVGGPVAMPKGALVRIDLPRRAAAPGSGALRWLIPPDALPKR